MSQTYRLWQNAWRDDPLASVISDGTISYFQSS